MRLINLIENAFWILPLCSHYAVQSISLLSHDDSKPRLIITNATFLPNPIAINPNSYHTFVCYSEFFVDSSKLIEYFGSSGRVVIVLPRGFGKSLNLLMVKCFYEIPVECDGSVCKPVAKDKTQAHQIFQKGLLTTCEHKQSVKLETDFQIKSSYTMACMNNIPVLYITFQRMTGEMMANLKSVYGHIITQILKVYADHFYLKYDYPEFNITYFKLKNPPDDEIARADLVYDSIQYLAIMMKDYFKQSVMLLIDEYDSILNTAFLTPNPLTEGNRKKLVGFFGQFFYNLLKDNDCIHAAFLTGIIPWKHADLLPAEIITVLDDYPINFYGISNTDLSAMHDHFKKKYNNISDTVDDLKQYYDGYLFGNLNLKCFNPISVACYFQFSKNVQRLQPYWSETEDISSVLRQLIKFSKFAEHFLTLLLPGGFYELQNFDTCLLSLKKMKRISCSIQSAVNLPPSEWYIASNADVEYLFLYLYATGYLTKNENSNYTHLKLQIPNQEIREDLWKNYHKVFHGRMEQEKNVRFQHALEKFAPYLGEIVKTDETDCSNLNMYFNLALLELPPFMETELAEDKYYYYPSEAQIESILSGLLNWYFNQCPHEQKHDFKKLENFPDLTATKGQPSIAVLYNKTITLFEIKLDCNFDHAYRQAMRYSHLHFMQSVYDEITQIKVIPIVVKKDRSVHSNATLCTREAFKTVESTNPTIRDELSHILREADISPECNATCLQMLDWIEWNCAAEQSQFDSWKNTVVNDCNEWLTKEMTYFQNN